MVREPVDDPSLPPRASLAVSKGALPAQLLPKPIKRYLLRAGTDRNSLDLNSSNISSKDVLISINIDAIDKRAPHYKNVDVGYVLELTKFFKFWPDFRFRVKVSLGNIEVGVCRPTVAAILQTATDFVSMLDAAELLPSNPPPTAPPSPDIYEDDEVIEISTEDAKATQDKTLLADVSISVTGIKLALLKDNDEFFTVQMNNFATTVTVVPDGKAHVEGFLGNILVRDPAQPKWGNFVSLEGDKVRSH